MHNNDAFVAALQQAGEEIAFNFDEHMIKALNVYADTLLEWNKKMNLTAITEPGEIAKKHFADSVTPIQFGLEKGARCIDVGTGAGFPGLVLKIVRPDIKMTLLDSLNKRLNFLKELCSALNITDVTFVHARAEDAGHNANLREKFDYAFTRAVASAPILMELMLPFIRVGGRAVCYKGKDASEEIKWASKAIQTLGGALRGVHTMQYTWGERSIMLVEKVKPTAKQYPRGAGVPAKKPL